MRRLPKILLASVAAILSLLALTLVLLSLFDWNRVKPRISDTVSEATGREFSIGGDLSLSWARPDQPFDGWRRWVPWPHLRAYDITLGNPDWAQTGPTMARIDQLDLSVELLPLIRKVISIRSLVLTEPELILEQAEDMRNNWTFKQDEEKSDSAWQLQVQDVSLTRGTVRLFLVPKKLDVTARIDTLTEGENKGGIRWELEGKMDKDKVSGGGTAGSLLSLQESGTEYPVQAELKVGTTEITAEGTLTDPASLAALDLKLKILGASMSQLFPLSGIVLPSTPKFSTEGRLVGKLDKDAMHLTYQDFEGKVGSSDLRGTLEYLQREPRPLLRGEVVSRVLDFKDLGALVGADPAAEQKKRGDEPKQPPDKAIPVAKFKAERWDNIDADVKFTGKKILRPESLPINDLSTAIKLDNGVLLLTPLNFGVAGGEIKTDIRIDGKAHPPKARMKIFVRSLELDRLFPKVKSMQASVGKISADANLTAAGDSPAALLGSANGEVKALITEGAISSFILEAMGLNVATAVAAKLFGDKQVRLNCMAADLKVTDGLMETNTFVIDTEDATIGVDGAINLDKERLDLVVRTDSKGVRIISLRSPILVQGTFKKPDIGVDKETLALKAGAATVLGTVAAPLAALLALINPGDNQDSPCAQLVAQAKEKPKAPPPGKTRTESRPAQK